MDRAGTGYPYFVYVGEGRAEIDASRLFLDVHMAEHLTYRGYKGFQPVLILKSNYLTWRLLRESVIRPLLAGAESREEENEPARYEIDLPNGFVFNDRTNEDALQIASAQINMANEELGATGVGVKLVTNPVFSAAFFEQEAWNTVFGDSDLLLPERELGESATRLGIPFLGLGAYMAAKDMTPADVQELYFRDGRGHYTPQGHEFVAEAIHQCFYAQSITAQAGCILP